MGVHFEVLLEVHGYKIHVFGSLGRLLLVGQPPKGVASTFFDLFWGAVCLVEVMVSQPFQGVLGNLFAYVLYAQTDMAASACVCVCRSLQLG